MAYSKPSKDLSASILGGSEEIFDYFCEPCSSDQHLEAAGYCKDCSQYLCVACIKYHGKLAATEHHTVLDKSAMPKTKLSQRPKQSDVLTEKCLKHPDKVLEYFCKTHNQICCSVCVTLDHGSCSGKSYIPDISGGIAKSQEYHKLQAEIDRLVREITKLQEQISDSGKNNEKYHDKALADIKDFRKQINELLDKMEEETKRKVTKLHQENVGIIGTASEKCQSLLSEIKSMAANIDASATAGKKNQLFVQVKIFCSRIAEVDRRVNENGQFKITRYAFYQDEKIQQMISTLPAIWSLSAGQDATPTKARFVREVNVKNDDETKECLITGVTLLTKDRLVVIDQKNKNVKLIDTKVYKVVSRLSLTSLPFDITNIKPNQVAVALGNEEKIGLIIVANTMSLSKTIKTPGVFIVGLCYNGSHFIAACQQPTCIKIIDMSGKTLKTISAGDNGEQLFTLPMHIALSRDRDVIYTTDRDAHTVTSTPLTGDVISVYKHDNIQLPIGIVVGEDGSVYVSSCATHTVHQLGHTGDLKRVILGQDQGLAHCPGAIAYDDDILYISSWNKAPEDRNYIRLYQLE